jgi:outer membrane protein assembly factor BamB
MTKRTLLPVLFAGLGVLLAGADWPQWRGPDRSDVSGETGLLKHWPKGGPKLLWTFDETGTGYGGPAVVGDRLYVMGTDEKDEFLLAIDVNTGKKVWSTRVGPYFFNKYGSGPRSTPTVNGDLVVVLGPGGDLACFERGGGGARKWAVNLRDPAIGGVLPGWGYSESPLVDGEQVVCSPGGSKGTFAAFDKNTGKVLWRSKEITDAAGYSSVVVANLGGVRQYVQQTMTGIAGFSPKDGNKLWFFANPKYRTAVIPTPIVHDRLIYAVAGYGAGASLLQVDSKDGTLGVEQKYSQQARDLMDNKHGGVVEVGDAVFGWSDAGNKWVCQDFKSGKEIWSSKALGRGSVTAADGNLYCFAEKDGTCVLVPAITAGWKEHGRFILPQHAAHREFNNSVWTHPVVANGRLYLRDQEFLFCYDVKDGAR